MAALHEGLSRLPFMNASLGIMPSPSDLYLAIPRLGAQIFNLFTGNDYNPNQVGDFWNATSVTTNYTNGTALGASSLHEPTPEDFASMSHFQSIMTLANLTFQRLGNFDGLFGYIASRWAVSTLAVAIILNRAHVFTSTREALHLNWKARVFLRIVPVALLAYQILLVTQVLRCQTSDQVLQLHFQGSDTIINKTWAKAPSVLHHMSSRLLFWETREDSCRRSNMVPTQGSWDWVGSTSVLWPIFMTLCLSHFMENISSALQGRQPLPETGMTIFEHSLAFAEAETVVRTSVGSELLRVPTTLSEARAALEDQMADNIAFTRPMIISRLNVPPEVLLICIISCCSHLSSHVLAMCGLQSRLRLFNTAVWGTMFISLFFYSFYVFARPRTSLEELQVIRYPTVCIVGFMPHLLIVVGLLISSVIYAIAIASTFISPPTNWPSTVSERFRWAHRNVKFSSLFTNIRIRPREDFYTFLLKAGWIIISAATDAVYFNQSVPGSPSPVTWLDEKRYGEILASRPKPSTIPLELQDDFAGGEGFGLVDEEPQRDSSGRSLVSGYARQRKTMQKFNKSGIAAVKEEGVGVSQRSGRWHLSWTLVQQTLYLVGYALARLGLRLMEILGAQNIPRWLRRAARAPTQQEVSPRTASTREPLQFWMISNSGEMSLPKDNNVDVEEETKKRAPFKGAVDPDKLDSHLYSWWKKGGWWGEIDASGEYAPSVAGTNDEDDCTSVISATSSSAWTDTDDALAESDHSGTRTPTRANPLPHSRDSTPQPEIFAETASNLARLLRPRSLEDKYEAEMLSVRLQAASSSRPMTRSQYRRQLAQDGARLFAPNTGPTADSGMHLMSPEDEELFLESIIMSRRKTSPSSLLNASQEQDPSSSQQQDSSSVCCAAGHQCAICHSSPRTVIVWPCRCLSLCEECRVSLASNGFGSCVCCRREVFAYSRLWVP